MFKVGDVIRAIPLPEDEMDPKARTICVLTEPSDTYDREHGTLWWVKAFVDADEYLLWECEMERVTP